MPRMQSRTLAPAAARAGLAVFLVVTVSHGVNDAFTSMLTPVLPEIRAHYGVSITQTAGLIALLSLVGSMTQPIVGMIGDRVNRRWLAAAGPVLAALGMTTMGYAPSYATLGLLIVVGGMGSALFHPAGAAYVATNAPLEKRGWMQSIFSAGGTVGIGLGPVIAIALGLRALPQLIPVGVAMGLVSFALTPDTRPAEGPSRSWREYVEVFSGPIRTLWGMSVLRSLSTAAYTSMVGFVFTDHHQGGAIGITLAVFSVAGALGGIVGGRISDLRGRTVVMRSSILITIPLFLGLIFSNPRQWWFYPLCFLVGALANANIPVTVVAAQEFAPQHVATASAIMMGFAWGTAGLLVLVVGKLADLTSPDTAMSVAVLVLLPALWLAHRIPEPPRDHADGLAYSV